MTQRLHNCGALLGLSALVRSRAPGPHYEPHPRPSSCLASSRVSSLLFPSDVRSAPTRRLFSGDKWRGRQRVMSANEAAGERASSGVLCVMPVVFRDARSFVSSRRRCPRISSLSGVQDKSCNRRLCSKINNFSIYASMQMLHQRYKGLSVISINIFAPSAIGKYHIYIYRYELNHS